MIHYKTIFLYLFICFFAIINAQAQQKYSLEYITTGGTIQENNVKDIIEDQLGFLWVATDAGLLRYDGLQFTRFLPESRRKYSLQATRIRCLTTDKNNNIWIGTENEGLHFYHRKSERFYKFPYSTPKDSIFLTKIGDIEVDDFNQLWIYSFDDLMILDIDQYKPDDLNTAQLKSVASLKSHRNRNNDSQLLYDSKDAKLWFTTNEDISYIRLTKKKRNPAHYKETKVLELPEFENQPAINARLLKRKNGELWLSFFDKVYRLQITDSGNYNIEKILELEKKPYWISMAECNELIYAANLSSTIKTYNTLNGKKSEINFFDKANAPAIIDNIGFTKILCDRNNLLWFASHNNGIMKLSPNLNNFSLYANSPNADVTIQAQSIRFIGEDAKKHLWIGGYTGLDRINPVTGKTVSFHPEFTKRYANDMFYFAFSNDPIDSNSVWIGCEPYGLHKINTVTGQIKHYFDHWSGTDAENLWAIYELFADTGNVLWIGHQNGLAKFDTQTEQLKKYNTLDYNMPAGRVYAIEKDENNVLWIGTDIGGLSAFDPISETFTNYKNNPECPNSLSSNHIKCIYDNQQGQLLIGTTSGLNVLDKKTGRFHVFTVDSGLPDNTVYGILEDKQNQYWLSTNKGLSCFNLKNKVFTNFGVKTGLQDDEFNTGAFFKTNDGQMFFGGIKGVTAFYPDRLKIQNNFSNLAITNFTIEKQKVYPGDTIKGKIILNQSINYTSQIELQYNHHDIEFEFACLDFTDPQQIRYSYQLTNLNDKFIPLEPGNQKIHFSSLNPGNYTLIIRATDTYQRKVANELQLQIKVLPPWWRTWWANLILISTILTILFLLYRYKISTVQKQKAVLEKTVIERTEALREKNEKILQQTNILEKNNEKLKELDNYKQGLMAMIVHDLKNPINIILNKTNDKTVIPVARKMLNLVLNILDVSKFEQTAMKLSKRTVYLSSLIQKSIDRLQFFAIQKNITVQTNLNPDFKVKVDIEVFQRILVNIIDNAIKFSQYNSKIIINTMQQSDKKALIEIINFGSGISPNEEDIIFDKFAQVKATRSSGVRSTGLGLAFCKLAVEAHDGTIGVKSRQGNQTVFQVTIPYIKIGVSDNSQSKLIHENLLNENEKRILEPYIQKLKNLELYNISQIRTIVNQLPTGNEPIEDWKDEITIAIDNYNEEKYKQLITMAKTS